MMEAGLPAEVLATITTSNSSAVVASIIGDPRLRKLSVAGSTEVGRVLLRQSADALLRVRMELGGSAPSIVFGDADIERAADQAVLVKLRNNGEACTAANRFLVHRSLVAAFRDALGARFEKLVIGPGVEGKLVMDRSSTLRRLTK